MYTVFFLGEGHHTWLTSHMTFTLNLTSMVLSSSEDLLVWAPNGEMQTYTDVWYGPKYGFWDRVLATGQ